MGSPLRPSHTENMRTSSCHTCGCSTSSNRRPITCWYVDSMPRTTTSTGKYCFTSCMSTSYSRSFHMRWRGRAEDEDVAAAFRARAHTW